MHQKRPGHLKDARESSPEFYEDPDVYRDKTLKLEK